MAKNYEPKAHNPILYHCKKNKLSQNDLCRGLNISKGTLRNWIKNSSPMTLGSLYKMSSLLNIDSMELMYLLRRYKPQIKPADKWYLGGRKSEFKQTIQNEFCQFD